MEPVIRAGSGRRKSRRRAVGRCGVPFDAPAPSASRAQLDPPCPSPVLLPSTRSMNARRALWVVGVLAGVLMLAIVVCVTFVHREWHRASYFVDARVVDADLRLPEHGFGRNREERAERAERCERVL